MSGFMRAWENSKRNKISDNYLNDIKWKFFGNIAGYYFFLENHTRFECQGHENFSLIAIKKKICKKCAKIIRKVRQKITETRESNG